MFYSIVLATTLAIDAFAVAISLSLSSTITRKVDYFKVALSFAIFQSVMPIIGMVIILPFEHFSVLIPILGTIFLLILGAKMIKESFEAAPNLCESEVCKLDGCCEHICKNTGKSRYLSFKDLVMFSIATSIDALLAGAIIVSLDINFMITILFIGVITFILSFGGAMFAKRFKVGFEKRMEFIGGIILILLAVKTIIAVING